MTTITIATTEIINCTGYWHQTQNLSPVTIAITDTMILDDHHEIVARELSNECSGKGNNGRKIFSPDNSMCKSLEKCYTYWSKIFKRLNINKYSTNINDNTHSDL